MTGFYPPSTDQQYTEDDPPTDHPDVLTQLCFDWEESAKLPPGCPTRLCTVRVGLALGRDGGVIQGSIWPFWLGLGGKKVADESFPGNITWLAHWLPCSTSKQTNN